MSTMKTKVIYDPTTTPIETITCKIELVLTRGSNEIEVPTGLVALAQLCMNVHKGIVDAIQENYDATTIKSLQTKAELTHESDNKKRRSNNRSKGK